MTRSAEKHHYGRLSRKDSGGGGREGGKEGSTLTLRNTQVLQLEPMWIWSSTNTVELPVPFTIVITHPPQFHTTPESGGYEECALL